MGGRQSAWSGASLALTIALVLATGLVTAKQADGAEARSCALPVDIVRFSAPTPALAQAIATNQPVRIVALGSSSTSGTGASANDKTYPAQLSAALRTRFPSHRFEVLNRGRGGELARDMLARLQRDVIAEKPTLVIWQTGVNDAIAGIDKSAFRRTLRKGLRRLDAHGIDVVLLDPQYYPKAAEVPDYEAYVGLMAEVGRTDGVPVFRRYRLMRHHVESGTFRPENMLAPDMFHLNDLSYRCLGEALAEALQRSVGAGRAAPALSGEPATQLDRD